MDKYQIYFFLFPFSPVCIPLLKTTSSHMEKEVAWRDTKPH